MAVAYKHVRGRDATEQGTVGGPASTVELLSGDGPARLSVRAAMGQVGPLTGQAMVSGPDRWQGGFQVLAPGYEPGQGPPVGFDLGTCPCHCPLAANSLQEPSARGLPGGIALSGYTGGPAGITPPSLPARTCGTVLAHRIAAQVGPD